MPYINVTTPHQLSKKEARQRIKDWLRQVAYSGELPGNLNYAWTEKNGWRFDLYTKLGTVTGWILLRRSCVEMSAHLPWILSAMADKAKEQMQQ
jgi:hypothetical protein